MCLNYLQVAMPMVHPVTGKTISSYKRPLNNPTTTEMQQTAFGKDFGGMVQGDLKMGQQGTNSNIVMTHNEISHTPKLQTVTYVHLLVVFCPQKADPHQICITASRN
jgi:hypothetical protein